MVSEEVKTDNNLLNNKELIDLMRSIYREEAIINGKKVLDLEGVKKELSSMIREESDRALEKKIAGFADTWAPFVITGDDAPLLQLLPTEKNRPAYGTEEEWLAFAAFAVAVNYERLQKNSIQEDALIQKYKPYFGKRISEKPGDYQHKYFFHLDILCRMDQVIKNSNNKVFLEKLLYDARQNSINLTNNLGGAHAFAETVALVFEHASPELRKYFEESTENWLEQAAVAAENALEIPYAKFYCTRGRIHALRGQFSQAILDVNEAIAKEDNKRKDYPLRLGQYNGFYQLFRAQQKLEEQKESFRQTVNDVSKEISQREDQISEDMHSKVSVVTEQLKNQEQAMSTRMEMQEKETMAKNMEFLGLFSGIVSFTIGSLTLASNFTTEDAIKIAGLIVVLLGALMCVFSAFGVILHGIFKTIEDKKTGDSKRVFIWRHLVVFFLGALIVIGGIVFCIK